ncbi:hypothetical protein H7X46_07625 [Pseudonocardia sp. C8]|uniref:hypothetical protein n=1 Tax=Pseudonocardia sp. C8 TaxID=2762759 RepID=UPI001642399C|nr:hypothetical protein [Pseudonocardia sp. C8]MBC3190930.1 hypothetical protein [Pseudonocardia sp. C8]
MSRRRPHVDAAEVRALEERLRALLAARGSIPEEVIASWEADREQLLDRIGDQLREQRAHDIARARLRAELDSPPRREAADGWAAGGLEDTHHAHLDALARVDEPVGDDALAGRVGPVVDEAGRGFDPADTSEHALRADSDPSAEVVERGDQERVRDGGPVEPVGGMWFTLDQAAPGGMRPLSEAELRALTDRVRATQAEALAQELDPAPPRPPDRGHEAADDAGWDR